MKMKSSYFIWIFMISFSNPLFCQMESIQTDSLAWKFVKQHCCKKDYIITNPDLICPDSIYISPVNNSSNYLIQVYFESFDDIGSEVFLVNFNQNTFFILDSIVFYQHDYLFIPTNIVYIDSVDWFYGYSEGWGSGFYEECKQIFKIENDQIVTLLEFPEYSSQMDFERHNWFATDLSVQEIYISKDTIELLLIQREDFVLFNRCFTYKKTKQKLRLVFDLVTKKFKEVDPVDPQIYMWMNL
jgi:hypothetical protein